MTEKERAAPGESGAVENITSCRLSTTTKIVTSTGASRRYRPHRRLSDEQINAAIQSLRDEQRYRREHDCALYHAELEQHRPKGARYGRSYQLDVMRRRLRVWRP